MRTDVALPPGLGMAEVQIGGRDGRQVLVLCSVGLAGALALLGVAVSHEVKGAGGGTWGVLFAVAAIIGAASVLGLRGLTRVQQGDAVVALLFGAYVGTIRARAALGSPAHR